MNRAGQQSRSPAERGQAPCGYPCTTSRLPHHTHIIVVAHVHPTVKHNILPRNRHEDTAAPHILASPWTNRKPDQTLLGTSGHFKGQAFKGLHTVQEPLPTSDAGKGLQPSFQASRSVSRWDLTWP